MHIISNIALRAAGFAVLAGSTTPVIAADVFTTSVAKQTTAANGDASDYRRYRRYRRDRIDGGDIAASIGILAGIAIIADIASKSKKNKNRTRGDRYPEQYPNEYPQDSRNNNADRNIRSGDDVGNAVSACSQAAERSAGTGGRVEEIRSVTRQGSSWQVLGDLSGGVRSFSCLVSDGEVQDIRLSDSRAI